MNKLVNQRYTEERSLFASNNLELYECIFESSIGESPIKEAKDIVIRNSQFSMRYPVWHSTNVKIYNTLFDLSTRAPFWYTTNLNIYDSKIYSPKALRECNDGLISNSVIESSEFGWKIKKYSILDSTISGEYAFFESSELDLNNVKFTGKYSFQYVKNSTIKDSYLDTKDAFWHSENITVINSVVKGEYLGWYSKGLHLINCQIIGTQPLCYCENLTLTNCTMIDCDLAFEYSSVDVLVNSSIDGVKNPLAGKIVSKGIKELVIDDNNRAIEEVIIEEIKE